MTTLSRRLMLAGPAGLLLLAGCAGRPAPAPTPAPAEQPEIAQAMEIDIVAIVESVDLRAREVLLRGPEGGLLTVRAGSQVRNLNRLRAGDRLSIRYRRAVAVFLAPANEGQPDVAAMVAAERAARGQRPAGAVGTLVAVRVVVTEVDRARNNVTFLGPRNIPRTVHVTDPEMRRRLRSLTPGTRLDVLYEEALAISAQPAPR